MGGYIKGGEEPELPFSEPDTSRAAAISMILPSGEQRQRLFKWARTQALGFTDQEAANALNMDPSSVRPRRGELIATGHIVESQNRRITSSGRKAKVWIVFGFEG